MKNTSWMSICQVSDLTKKQLKHVSKFIGNIKDVKSQSDKDIFHVCYCVVNLVNGKCYFGKHTFWYNPKTYPVTRYKGTSKYLRNSILKHGIENFRMVIINYFTNEEKAYKYEQKLITDEMIKSKYCYNQMFGGKGLTSASAKMLIDKRTGEGTNPLQKRSDGSSVSSDKVKCGKHHFLSRSDGSSIGKEVCHKRIKDGTFHLSVRPDSSSIGGDSNKHRTELGLNPFQKRTDGSSVTGDRVKNGTHPFLGVRPWEAPSATVNSLNTWSLADVFLKYFLKNPSKSYYALTTIVKSETIFESIRHFEFAPYSVNVMIKKFKSGWTPKNDSAWKKFKKELGREHSG